MKGRVVLPLTLAACLALGACGNSEATTDTGTPAQDNNTVSDTEISEDAGAPNASDETLTAGDASESPAVFEDTVEITMAFFSSRMPKAENLEAVENAINEISESKLNVRVHLLPIEMGNYAQQLNLMIAGNEPLDLMATYFFGSTTFSSMQAQGQCLPLDDLLAEYGQDISGLFDQSELDTCTLNGELLGVPVYKDYVSQFYYAMRTDVLEDLGLLEQAKNITSMQDIEEILTAVKENTDLIPIASAQAIGPLHHSQTLFTGEFADADVFSKIVNDYIGVFADNPDQVVNLYATDEYKASVELVKDWYDKGFVYKDSATTTESTGLQMESGKFFSTFFSAENATKIASTATFQYDVTTVAMYSQPLTSSSYNTSVWIIPVTSKEPEAAMAFLNLMYTEKAVVDLLNYGIEGVDYVIKEDGSYGYPDGLNIANVGYHEEKTWLFGNQYLAGVWEGDDPDVRKVSKEINDAAKFSPIFGFTADVSDLSTEMAGITSAVNEYAGSLQNGLADVDSALEEFNKKLDVAGMDKVLEAVQEQLDTWKAGKQ